MPAVALSEIGREAVKPLIAALRSNARHELRAYFVATNLRASL
jgi:hypothetical protein